MSSTNGNATALDVIIVVPSRSRRRPPTSSGSNNYQEGVIASSDFYVTFPSSSAVQYATNKRDTSSNTSSVATLQRWTSSFFSNASSREFNESSYKASAKKPPESDHIVDYSTTNDPPRTTASSKAESAPIDVLEKSLGNPKRGNVQVQINGRPIPALQMNCRAYKNGESISKFVVGNGLRPSTESLEKLVNEGILNYGRNLIKYILLNDKNDRVSTAEAFLYLWSARDSVIVCDIDGTITKSDVRGVLDTVIQDNFQHIHKGVCRFFHEIINAYELDKDKSKGSEGGQLRFFYLSSRPISYISQTRKLLVGLSQQHERISIGLPPGPIMCHRGSLSTVLHSELVLKNVYEFKADVLVRQIVLPFVAALGDYSIQSDDHSDEVSRRGSDLSELTANCADYRLFLCGFGNKSTDAKAYQLAGMDRRDIYIINKESQIQCLGSANIRRPSNINSLHASNLTFASSEPPSCHGFEEESGSNIEEGRNIKTSDTSEKSIPLTAQDDFDTTPATSIKPALQKSSSKSKRRIMLAKESFQSLSLRRFSSSGSQKEDFYSGYGDPNLLLTISERMKRPND